MLPDMYDCTIDMGSKEMFNIDEEPTKGVHLCRLPTTAKSSLEIDGYVSDIPDNTPVAQVKVTYYIDFFN